MKSEPGEVSVDDALAAPQATVPWTGVRNYQARNYMRDSMRVGDGVLFYHSSCAEPGIVGIAQVASPPYPDPTQFDPTSPYHDPASKPDEPRWLVVDIQTIRKTRNLTLPELRADAELADGRTHGAPPVGVLVLSRQADSARGGGDVRVTVAFEAAAP